MAVALGDQGLRSQLPHQDPPEREQDEAELLRVERELTRLREALALRDPEYVRRCESLDVHRSTPEDIRNRLRALGPRTTYLRLLAVGSIGYLDLCVLGHQLQRCLYLLGGV